MIQNSSRRNFLLAAPVAAAISLSFPETLFAATADTAAPAAVPATFQFYTAQDLQDAAQALRASAVAGKKGGKNGLKDLANAKGLPFTYTLTTEENKIANTFEFHDGKDHVLQIIDGTTRYEVGGAPQNARSNGPGEWLTEISNGSTALTLHKGDTLVIPRGTPHKRMTEGSVSLIMVTSYGSTKP